jgi:hypothetical protein
VSEKYDRGMVQMMAMAALVIHPPPHPMGKLASLAMSAANEIDSLRRKLSMCILCGSNLGPEGCPKVDCVQNTHPWMAE